MKSLDDMPAVRTPEAPQKGSPIRLLEFRLPHWETGSATSTKFDFGAMFPFTVVPAYHLPVYASQCPSPVHHARLGTRLLARLYQGSHLRLLYFMRLQGATPSEPDVRLSSHPALQLHTVRLRSRSALVYGDMAAVAYRHGFASPLRHDALRRGWLPAVLREIL